MIINRYTFYIVFILCLCIAFSIDAEQENVKIRPDIRITIKTSRSVLPADANFGLFADITNASQTAIYFKPKYICICPPPELDPDAPHLWWATMNTVGAEIAPDFEKASDKTEKERNAEKWANFWHKSHRVVRLGPGDTTTVFWGGMMSKEKEKEYLNNLVRILNFTPGEYLIKVVALYWIDEQSAKNENINYITVNSETKVNFIAPQFVIIIGAILGGIIAYIILPSARADKRINIFGIVTAMLLSVIVTVLISRISDAQFFIRLTVTDLWGSIAIGFAANATGISLIKKYLPSGQRSLNSSDENTLAMPQEISSPSEKK